MGLGGDSPVASTGMSSYFSKLMPELIPPNNSLGGGGGGGQMLIRMPDTHTR